MRTAMAKKIEATCSTWIQKEDVEAMKASAVEFQ
jgi:hypothetical protein